MSANRRLQVEIDRCLKKVNEGVEKFEESWQKFHHSSNPHQKERLEEELRKEIKKLQKCREQIKVWIGSSSMNKSVLIDKRKLIELQMDRFKAVERETKTKAYSREGLVGGTKMHPVEKEREKLSKWMRSCIDSLNLQNDQFEAGLDNLNSFSKKKKNRDHAHQIKEYTKLVERHTYHIQQLETLLRMLLNGEVDIVQIKDIKDSVEYYIYNCREPGFMEDEGIYDDIREIKAVTQDVANIILSESPALPTPKASVVSMAPSTPKSSSAMSAATSTVPSSSSMATSDQQSSSSSAAAETAVPTTKGANANNSIPSSEVQNSGASEADKLTNSNNLLPSSEVQNSGASEVDKLANSNNAIPSSEVQNSGASEVCKLANSNNASHSSGVKYNGASEAEPTKSALAEQLNGHASGTKLPDPLSPPSNGTDYSTPPATPTRLNYSQVVAKGNSSTEATVAGRDCSSVGGATNNTRSDATEVSSVMPMTQQVAVEVKSGSNEENEGLPLRDNGHVKTTSSEPSTTSTPPAVTVPPSSMPSMSASAGTAGAAAAVEAGSDSRSNNNEGTRMSHISPLLGVAPLGKVPWTDEMRSQHAMLMAASRHMPHPSDSEKRTYLPRQPCVTPAYYPQFPPIGLDSVEFYLKLSAETLFFIFYYMEGTKAQLLAANALKLQSWRFHTGLMMWFQRVEQPMVVRNDFEKGTYYYFDYEKWGQIRKEGFIFEYRFLEDRALN